MRKKSFFDKQDPAIIAGFNKQKEMKPRLGLVYEPTMDNVIIEAVFEVPEVEEGKVAEYVAPHLRPTAYVKVIAVGPAVNGDSLIGKKVILDPRVRVTSIEMDEIGYIGTVKPHEIIAVIA